MHAIHSDDSKYVANVTCDLMRAVSRAVIDSGIRDLGPVHSGSIWNLDPQLEAVRNARNVTL